MCRPFLLYAIDVYMPLAYIKAVVFIETPIFTRQLLVALTDDQYAGLQGMLMAHPDIGVLIKGGSGIRKIRWAANGRGKSGGVRVVYFWRVAEAQIMFLTIYAKNEQTNLTPAQVKQLARYVEALK